MQALLDSGLEISGVRTLAMEGRDIEDYLEAYKGVIPEYGKWLTELASGPSVVLEVRGERVVPRVRAICGPYCPQIARHLRPTSLRAQFGVDRTRNAVFCTDIEQDGPLESKFLFRVADG
jgi:nucleoside-diphosphate kinase